MTSQKKQLPIIFKRAKKQAKQNEQKPLTGSVFSLLGLIIDSLIAWQMLLFWLHPKATDVKMIYSFSVLMGFEFIMIHSGIMMNFLGKSWKGWLCLICFYGLFAFAFNMMVNDYQIIILYCSTVLNRMIAGIHGGKDVRWQNGFLSVIYALVYFLLLVGVVLASSHIPEFGLTSDFLQKANYNAVVNHGSIVRYNGGMFTDEPQTALCFGVLYYIMLALLQLHLTVKWVKGLVRMFRQPLNQYH